MSDICPREWLYIWWAFINCNLVSPNDAHRASQEAKQRKNSTAKAKINTIVRSLLLWRRAINDSTV